MPCYSPEAAQSGREVKILRDTIDKKNAMMCAIINEISTNPDINIPTLLLNASTNGKIPGILEWWPKHLEDDLQRVYTTCALTSLSKHELLLVKQVLAGIV